MKLFALSDEGAVVSSMTGVFDRVFAKNLAGVVKTGVFGSDKKWGRYGGNCSAVNTVMLLKEEVSYG